MFFFQSVILQLLEAALVWTNYIVQIVQHEAEDTFVDRPH